ncbi:helix-turn-helix domain-containing protein [Haloarcula marina]|uniref:helix-turn-helix domain-containing protein n=1 Tax=Haloarcula marina TaxID=2961574 RepID=UPI0020B8B43C|nr:helix-turn-helix domain-containing protein [Halomicroarcula marina]
MPIITDVTVTGDSFALGNFLADNPEIRVEIERVVPLGDRLLPFVWVSDGSTADVEAELMAQPLVKGVERLTSVDDRHLFQMTWTSEVNGLVEALSETNGAIIEGQGIAGQWELRLRFPDRDSLQVFNDICEKKGIDIDVTGVYNPHAPAIEGRLTQTQWETLVTAYEMGYFEVPRQATLADLAEHFDVSEQAVSQRLRRAMNAVVSGVLFET